MRIRSLGIGAALVGACLAGGAQAQDRPASKATEAPGVVDAEMQELAKRPTPKLPNGKPDLNGTWFSYTGVLPLEFSLKKSADGSLVSSVNKSGVAALTAAFQPTANPPQYKPEFQAKLKQMQSQNLNSLDKVYLCGQPGLPRVGAPEQIIQQANQVVFLNADLAGMVYRVASIGGTYHDVDPSYYGEGVARWEGDTLVVDTRNLSTDTWIGEEGFFHSEQLRIIERFRRVGDTIEYNVTAEDPGVLEKPWVKPTRILKKTDKPLQEPYPCDSTNTGGLDQPRHDQRAK